MNEPFDHHQQLEALARPVLVATDEAARARALAGFDKAGLRPGSVHLVGDIGVDALADRALWFEIGEGQGDALDQWMMALDALLRVSEAPATLSMTAPMIDLVAARFAGDVAMLVAPDPIERVAALATLAARADRASPVRETRGVEDAERLRKLSEEVSRIAETLSRMSASDAGAGYGAGGARPSGLAAVSAPVADGVPAVEIETVRATIRARRLREKYFAADYFADPAWDMLLDLLAAEIAQHRVPVSSLCIAAAVPATTALRWMKTLTDAGIFRRRADPHDGRRVFVELSSEASLAMRRYFSEARGLPVV